MTYNGTTPERLSRVVEKREKEVLPILEGLRKKYPGLRDDHLLAYMFLMMKDKATGFRRKASKIAAELGSRGGKARAKKLSKEQRAEIAKAGGKARWQPTS